MLKRIMVPLDGSPLSERALVPAEQIAWPQGAEILLAYAVEAPVWIVQSRDRHAAEAYDQFLGAMETYGQEQLRAAEAKLREGGASVTRELLRGHPASALLDFEQAVSPDLVVMATHGRTGMARFALGSVTDRIVTHGRVPLLLIRAPAPSEGRLERALVPLDGSALAEQALPMVATLAGKPLTEVHLVRAIENRGERVEAYSYLQRIAKQLPTGLNVQLDVPIGEPGGAIQEAAQWLDLVIMTTHGRSGFDRFRHGSIAERATRALPTPTLLVRAVAGDGAARSTEPLQPDHVARLAV